MFLKYIKRCNRILQVSIFLWGSIFLQSAYASTTPALINKLPLPGKEAYIVKNPKDLQQKIVLIPSYHLLPFSKADITQDIRDAIDKGDVLILENYTPGYYDLDDAQALKVMLPSLFKASSTVLKEKGIIKDSPFTTISGKVSWIQAPVFTSPEREQLQKMFKPLLETLGKQDVGQLHPAIVFAALSLLEKSKIKLFGMDVQTALLFSGANKPIEGLEKSPNTELPRWAALVTKFPIDDTRLQLIRTTLEKLNNIFQASPLKQREKALKDLDTILGAYDIEGSRALSATEIVSRNQAWINPLLSFLKKYQGKVVIVEVGAIHFPGPQGILKLLVDQGLTFESMPPAKL